MECEKAIKNQVSYALAIQNQTCIYDESGFFEVLSCCYEQDTDRVLLYAENFCAEFFDISSGLAGTILQKLTNYRIKTAIVLNETTQKSSLFSQMVQDANRMGLIHFFSKVDEAAQWLTCE
jgi:hypothetical protein